MAYFTPKMMSLLILLAVSWKLGGATGTQRSHMYTNVGLNDKAFTEDVVFESSARSKSQCALKCNEQDSCAAFTLDNKVCRGHAAVMTSQSQSRPATGARSFFKVNNDAEKKTSCPKKEPEGSQSGVVTIYPDNVTALQVYRDEDTDCGGWTVFQRRMDGSVDFYRNWVEYQNGFGNLTCEFWLGLDALHMLTSRQRYELRVDLMMWNGTKGYATYSNFSISDSSDNYRLNFDSFTGGNAGDSLTYHRGQQFSTWDRDHDWWSEDSCAAQSHHGAWWYNLCARSSLNGQYMNSSADPNTHGLWWYHFTGWHYSFQFTEMKIRAV